LTISSLTARLSCPPKTMEVPVKCRVTLLFALMTLVLIRGGAAEPGSPAVRSELVPTDN
jgi:hypothetical protein